MSLNDAGYGFTLGAEGMVSIPTDHELSTHFGRNAGKKDINTRPISTYSLENPGDFPAIPDELRAKGETYLGRQDPILPEDFDPSSIWKRDFS